MIKMPTFNDLLTIGEAADMLGVSRQRVHALIVTYKADTVKKSDRLTLIERKEVERILREKSLRYPSQNN